MTNRDWILAIFATVVLSLMLWASVSAQDAPVCEITPEGATMCCKTQPDGTVQCTSSISSTLTPFVPTATLIPTIVPTVPPTFTPTPGILPLRRVYLPIGAKP